ncbi:hypothetical protein AB7200_06275 [Providencia alcalifaciens]|uniref:hypothetical protein n=1 Tax=Providencia manganoxydans TaxID=2923283 RepID=UPI0034E55EF8
MAGNTFDFELVADDKASGVIRQIESELSRLRPSVQGVKENLRLGGNDTISDMGAIGDKLRNISDFAKNGVQNIGDMIPPLKNFGELSNKYLGLAKKIGGIGAIGYAGYQMASQIRDEGKKATDISTSAKSMGMSVEEETRLTGTLQQRGVSEEDARQSISNYYVELDKAARGDNNELLASIRYIGAELVRNKDGSADITKTLASIEKAVTKVPESRNWELQSKVGLDANMLGLMREGQFEKRLKNSDDWGLTRKTQTVEDLSKVDTAINEIVARWEGKKTQIKDSVNGFAVNDSFIMGGAQELLEYGPDSAAINRSLGIINGEQSKILRWAYETPEFKDQLGWLDQVAVDFGYMTDNIQKEYDKWVESHPQPTSPEPRINIGDKIPDYWSMTPNKDPRVRAFRNNNPGNVREASNEIGRDEPGVDIYGNKKGFAIFQDENDGRAALARQLLLFMDRGNNTLDGIMQKYAPRKDNNKTGEYIRYMSQHMGVGPYQPLDLYDPDVLANAMNGIIKKETGYQPYSYEEMMGSIDDAINHPKWAGLRNPTRLMEQRDRWYMESEQQQEPISQSAPSVTMNDVSANANIAEVIGEAIRLGLAENQSKGTLEIVLTNPVTGAKQLLNVNTTGRITTAMDLP